MSLSIVCWKWAPHQGYRSTFGPETVNVLRRMVQRHYPFPHRFKCVTDDAEGIDPDVEILPPWNDFTDLPSPHGGKNPSCYRRLRLFHPDIGAVFGERFVSLDLDTVITGDLTPIFHRPEEIVLWGDTNPRTFYNGSMVLMSAGARPQVWDTFDPTTSPHLAKASGNFGSDQGWISYCLGPDEARWSRADGVYSYRNDIARTGLLPAEARLISFHGRLDPWNENIRRLDWVKEHYR